MITKLMIASTNNNLAYSTATEIGVPSNEVEIINDTAQLDPEDIYLILASKDISDEFGELQYKLMRLPNVRYIQYADIRSAISLVQECIRAWTSTREYGVIYPQNARLNKLKEIMKRPWFDARVELQAVGNNINEILYPRNSYSCGVVHLMNARA